MATQKPSLVNLATSKKPPIDLFAGDDKASAYLRYAKALVQYWIENEITLEWCQRLLNDEARDTYTNVQRDQRNAFVSSTNHVLNDSSLK